MRRYVVIALCAFVAGALLTGAASLIAHNRTETPAVADLGSSGGSVWGAEYFPNIPLVTHEGERVQFFDDVIKDKVVAINFIYTSCPDTCPVETARMLQVARLLGDRLGRDIFFYSITIDPEHDTQAVLKEFAESWKIPDGWKFLTGKEEDIVLLRQKVGMRIDDVRSGELSDHTINLLIGNQATGRWMKRSPFENPYVLANQLGSWLHGWKKRSERDLAYEDAPELRTISDGEYIFRNLCSACHTIGGGAIVESAERIGPDLYNISGQRDREWLIRWLMEPDKMLEEGDPLAVALMAQYRNIPMPNLRLTEKDASAILGYIDGESRRLTALMSRDTGKHTAHADHVGHGSAPAEHGGDHGNHSAHGDQDDHSSHGDHSTPHGDHGSHGEG